MTNDKKIVLGLFFAASCALSTLSACETDSYEKGTGEYSLVQADFCELTVDAQQQGTRFTTDEGEQFTFAKPFSASWIQTADTTYRTIIYYNKVAIGQAESVSISAIATLTPIEHWRFKELYQDPIGVESIWLATSGRYVNLGLLMKTARIDDEELPHSIGLAQDTLLVNPDQTRTAYYRFLHSQNGIPEYYTNRRYVSILIPDDRPDTIRLSIQTYNGILERSLPLN